MAKIYKISGYVVDSDGFLGDWPEDALEIEINDGFHGYMTFEMSSFEESKYFDWDDDLKINQYDCTIDDYEEFFKKK